MDIEEAIRKKFEDMFWEILNEETTGLTQDEEYQKINSECIKIAGKNVKIQELIETNKAISLNQEEVALLVQYYKNCIDRMVIEQQKMFFAGGRYAYYLFKEMGILK